uniref:Single-stranded DNA-binding protein WHY1, chloroplastic n=1 Tax=Aegilops tauschii subsp. strangulata TaxID=200361 RepID=A0A453QN07_AEGTS
MPPPLSVSLPSPQPLSLLPRHARAAHSHPLALAQPLSTRAPPSSACSVVPARHSDYFDPRAPPSQRDAYGQPPLEREPPVPGGQAGRVFASYSIYKGKAALAFDPRPPQFVPLESGAYKVAKEGFVLLQFAPAVGPRQYDWTRKQVFSLSVWEMGTLLTLGLTDSCEFFHDPFKGRRL